MTSWTTVLAVGDHEGVRAADPTPDEGRFVAALLSRVPQVQDWYHEDADGSLWMCVSLDFVRENGIVQTLRLDFDSERICGGWSPGFLNWDDGVRARVAGVDTAGSDGIGPVEVETPELAAELAADWLLSLVTRMRDHEGLSI